MKKKIKFRLNIQLFAEEPPKEDSEVIKTIKGEFEKQINDLKNDYENKISELNKSHIEQIKALVSGRSENLNEETKKLQNEEKELSFEEQLLKDTRAEFGLKEEN